MLSATARVRMIVGALAEMGVKRIPDQPARPIPVRIENAMIITVVRVPQKVRRVKAIITRTMPYMRGTRDVMSPSPASLKALSMNTTPVR